MIKIVMVGIGGCLGSILRFLVSDLVNRMTVNSFFPFGTLTVNILGCLLIGFLGGMSEAKQIFSPEIRTLVLVGFIGGFTTFSTFGYESFNLARDGQLFAVLTNIMLHGAVGFGAVWFGFIISKAY